MLGVLARSAPTYRGGFSTFLALGPRGGRERKNPENRRSKKLDLRYRLPSIAPR